MGAIRHFEVRQENVVACSLPCQHTKNLKHSVGNDALRKRALLTPGAFFPRDLGRHSKAIWFKVCHVQIGILLWL
jgi:hypothetical protein